jgi:hypothetical protein
MARDNGFIWIAELDLQCKEAPESRLGPDGGNGSDALNTLLEFIVVRVKAVVAAAMVDLLGMGITAIALLRVEMSLGRVGNVLVALGDGHGGCEDESDPSVFNTRVATARRKSKRETADLSIKPVVPFSASETEQSEQSGGSTLCSAVL